VGSWGLYIAFLLPALVLGLAVQWYLKRSFAEQSAVPVTNGMTGAEIARAILDANGLHEVPVNESPGGPLSDHYDPRKRGVYLSHPVYAERSVSASAVAAHEVGHAIQHKEAYSFFRFRSALFPAVAISSSLWMVLLFAGFILQIAGLALAAIALYAVAVLFHFITLPVEFDASKRAAVQLQSMGLATASEAGGVKKVLNAAALTYVAGALAALTQLIYFALMFLGED
jgi:Zn-dependent membrane protease YugP